MRNERIEVIDILRGLSCLGVLLYHIRIDLWIGWWRITSYPQEYSSFAKAMAWLSVPTPFLGYAILLFFLISGFCIHFPNTGPDSKPSWRAYFTRRFWRIYPTYLLAILLSSIISFFCYLIWEDPTWSPEKVFRVATISQNYPPENGQFLSNPSLWTIPLEVEFYVLYPLAFCIFSRLRSSLVLFIAFGCSALTVYLNSKGMQWLSFTALFLWPSWLLGAWIANLHRDGKIHIIRIPFTVLGLMIFLSLALISRLKNWESWLQYASGTAFYFFLFVLFLQKGEAISRIRKWWIHRLFSWLGKISFSLYLIHFPLFKLLGYLHQEFFGGKPANFLFTLLYLIPVIFLAWIFFKWVENPIHQWSRKRNSQK